ncbi:MAG: hypothetical protein AAGH43_06060 [Pseudomonadota bacterium]
MTDPRYELLAPGAREVADAIGVDATLSLIEAHGGARIFIPATCSADHWLATLLGHEKALKLCGAFSVAPEGRNVGAYIVLPLGHASAIEQARAASYRTMHEALDAGASVDEAVRRSGLSRATVNREKRRRRSNETPPLLAMMVQAKR